MNKSLLKTKKQILFCPGPVNIADNVREALTAYEIGHREEEFSTLLASLTKKLLQVYNIKKPNLYYPVVITGSGTASNEAVLSSIVTDKGRVLAVSNGEFGERLYDISKIHNKNTTTIKFEWGKDLDLKKIESYLKNKKIELLAMVHHETSTGMINPVAKVGKLCKKYGAKLFIDTISSAGVEEIDLEKWNVTFCSGSAGKAIGAVPGLSYIIGKVDEFEKLKNIRAKTMYLNLYKFYTYSKTLLQTPNTPAVNLFFGLEQALTNILTRRKQEGVDSITAKVNLLRTGMRALGLKFLLTDKQMSSILTTVIVPKDVDFVSLKNELKKNDIIIYNGKGPLANKVFQVGNIGELSKEKVLFFLKNLKETLDVLRNDSIYEINRNNSKTKILFTTKEASVNRKTHRLLSY